nr:hypothetical protein [Tanacetum cinerariifolium]
MTKPHNKTPYELLLGRSPSIGLTRPFGCPVTILNTLDPLGKFDGKDDEGFLVGYFVNSKAFIVFNRIGPKWLFDIDTLTKSMNYQPVVAGNQPNDNVGIKENLDAGKVGKEIVSAQQYVQLPSWSIGLQDPQNTIDATGNKKHDEKAKRDDKGKNPVDLPTGVRDLRAEFEEFSFNSTNRVNAISAPVDAAGPNPTYSTSPFISVVSLNFGIARISSFMDPSKYLDDPDMPELEDVIYSDDEEDVGVEADLSNLETHISVSPIPTTRVHKDHIVNQIIGDLNLAPQIRSMTRMVKEQGGLHQKMMKTFTLICLHVFFLKKNPKKYTKHSKILVVLKPCKKSFYNLKCKRGRHAKSTFLYGTIEEEEYVCQPPGFEDPDYPDKVYKVVKVLYGLHQAPRAWITSKAKRDGIFSSQDKYVAEILRKFGFTDVKSASTLIETEKPLLKNHDGEDVDVHIYRLMIGSLMYLTSSRPDIIYLKGKPHLGLWYPKDSPFNLVAYSDSDYARASLDRKSTTGGCQFLVTTVSSYLMLLKEKYYGLCFLGFGLTYVGKELASPKQTALGKDISNPFMASSYVLIEAQQHISNKPPLLEVNTPRCDEDSIKLKELMVFMATATIKKVNDVVQLCALINEKKVVVSEDVIRRDLRLDDADRCLSAKRTAWNEFSCSMASAVICLATGVKTPLFASMLVSPQPQAAEEEEEVEMPNAPTAPSPTTAPSPPLQDPTPTPNATPHASPT